MYEKLEAIKAVHRQYIELANRVAGEIRAVRNEVRAFSCAFKEHHPLSSAVSCMEQDLKDKLDEVNRAMTDFSVDLEFLEKSEQYFIEDELEKMNETNKKQEAINANSSKQ